MQDSRSIAGASITILANIFSVYAIDNFTKYVLAIITAGAGITTIIYNIKKMK
jgi:hypothetical protein